MLILSSLNKNLFFFLFNSERKRWRSNAWVGWFSCGRDGDKSWWQFQNELKSYRRWGRYRKFRSVLTQRTDIFIFFQLCYSFKPVSFIVAACSVVLTQCTLYVEVYVKVYESFSTVWWKWKSEYEWCQMALVESYSIFVDHMTWMVLSCCLFVCFFK